jgi:hypothetical protein
MRKEESDPSNKSAKEHEHTLSQITRWMEWIWDLERLLIFWFVSRSECTSSCIEWKTLEDLDAWSCGGWGVFIALNHQEAVGEGCWRWAHRTVCARPDRSCSLSGAPPCHPTVRVRSSVNRWSFVFLRHRTVRCPSDFLLWLLRCTVAALFTFAKSTFARVSCCSSGTPDSLVNYSGVRLLKPESGWLDSVRSWCTGHCPLRQTTAHLVSFAPLNFIPNLNIYWFLLNLCAPVEHVF